MLETLAILVFEDDQAFVEAAVPEPVSAVVAPLQTVKFPVIVGKLFTVTVTAFE